NHEKHERYEKKRNNEMITSKNFVLFVSFVVKMNQSKRIWDAPPFSLPTSRCPLLFVRLCALILAGNDAHELS
ncbi:MAG: hypothetical protein LBQ35_00295, partial [Spirochaetaceae bacterium]|nr:hypothetical protein [Spirochaetaceae bacterium]